MPSSSSGGATAAGGFNFQHRVTTWAAVRVLAEAAAPPAWELPADTTFEWLRCETEQPVDDLLIGTSRGLVFCNIKTSVRVATGDDSAFASVVRQFVQQFASWQTRSPGNKPWERRLERTRDRFVLVCGPTTSTTIKVHLRSVLERCRSLVAGQLIADAAVNEDERRVLTTFTDLSTSSWEAVQGQLPSPTDLLELLGLIHIQVLALDASETDELETKALLRSSVVLAPTDADAAWSHLVANSARLAENRSGTDRSQLQQVLLQANLGLRAAPPTTKAARSRAAASSPKPAPEVTLRRRRPLG
jgi:hypothetical protein